MSQILRRFLASGVIVGLTLATLSPNVGFASDSEDPESSTTTIEMTTTTTTATRVTPRVLLVGDSTAAALRWFRDGKKGLTGATFIVDVESCRSVAGESCRGREKRIPTNALTVIESTPGPFDAVVLMAGTHNEKETIELEFRQVQELTQAMGVKLIVLTLRDLTQEIKSVSLRGQTQLGAINQFLKGIARPTAVSGTYVADWKSFTKNHQDWFRADGIHLNIKGALGLGWYVSRVVAHVLDKSCSSNGAKICSVPTPAQSSRDWVRYFNVKYTDMHCYEDGRMRTRKCERDRRMP